jgi:hypothetical protein
MLGNEMKIDVQIIFEVNNFGNGQAMMMMRVRFIYWLLHAVLGVFHIEDGGGLIRVRNGGSDSNDYFRF